MLYSWLQVGPLVMDGVKFELNDNIKSLYTKTILSEYTSESQHIIFLSIFDDCDCN